MIAAVRAGASLDKLEAMTCVLGWLIFIAVPGDTSAETISAIIADEAAIEWERKNHRRAHHPRPDMVVATPWSSAVCWAPPPSSPSIHGSVDFIARRSHPRPHAEPEKLIQVEED